MDATSNEDVPDGFKVQVRIGQKNTVNTSPVGSVNSIFLSNPDLNLESVRDIFIRSSIVPQDCINAQ